MQHTTSQMHPVSFKIYEALIVFEKKKFSERSQIDKNWTHCLVQSLLLAKTLVQFKSVKLIFKHGKRQCWYNL